MASTAATQDLTVAELLYRLGGVAASRVRLVPVPGTATEQDVIEVHDRTNRLCELVDGVLVEKVMGFDESRYAVFLITVLGSYLAHHDIGTMLAPDGMVRLFPGQVRIPDVAFISWKRFPRSKRERGEIPTVAPDLVVEILSKGNTKREMARKLDDYFRAGVRLVWYVDPKHRMVRVYTSPVNSVVISEEQHLDGGAVLPGFSLSIREWFDEAERTGPR
jgi:Uma2 family endonuclease